MNEKEIKRLKYNERQREYRKNNKNKVVRKYEKTEKGFMMRLYRNMKSRVSGVQKQKFHLYQGKTLLSKEEFYEWFKNNKDKDELFRKYEESGFDRKLAPSVDRIDSSKGYELDNIRLITHSENSRLGLISRYLKANGSRSILINDAPT
jgi:hypothetical protein